MILKNNPYNCIYHEMSICTRTHHVKAKDKRIWAELFNSQEKGKENKRITHCYNENTKKLRKQGLILMNAIIQNEAMELGGWDGQAEAHSIYEAMQQLKDKRRKQGKRYPIALIMTYLLLAKAAGETTLQATSEWIRLR